MSSLILKHNFVGKQDGKDHVSSMKFKPMPDGTVHVWLNNGDGNFTQFRIENKHKDKLIEFLQCNIK